MASFFVDFGMSLRHCASMRTIISNLNSSNRTQAELHAELRQMRATGKRIASNKKLARRFLVATGMYTLKGGLKRQFR
jgi:hypothetical protein